MPGGRSAQTGQQGFTPAPCPCRQPMVPPAEAMAMLVSLRAEPCARPGQGQRWPLPASTGRYWPVLAGAGQKPLESGPAAMGVSGGGSCRPLVQATLLCLSIRCLGSFTAVWRAGSCPAGRARMSCSLRTPACGDGAARSPGRLRCEGTACTAGIFRNAEFSGHALRPSRHCVWGCAPVAPGPFPGWHAPRAEACNLAGSSLAKLRTQASIESIFREKDFFLDADCRTWHHANGKTERKRGRGHPRGMRQCADNAGMVRADCRSCRHSQCETSAKAPARLAQGPSGADCLARIAWRGLSGRAPIRWGGASRRESEQGVKGTWAA